MIAARPALYGVDADTNTFGMNSDSAALIFAALACAAAYAPGTSGRRAGAIACASRRSVRAGISPIHACVRRIQPGIRHDSARRSSRMVFVGGRVRPTIGGAPHRTAGACAPPRCACRRASRGALAPPARAVSVLACDGRNRRASSDRPTGRGGVDCS
ncbi:hypothetical protein VP95_10120 [Burkholderia pseudomallei]|nr:hypothetical protein VP95_10120 [Burkholderia pseudomallei]OND56453.1 hypothetical protein AQ937_18300 [Burkholderia pseudomallei]OND64090.1 hypothetical protein AQ936_04425 [Burkholderia pseudomallei]OND71764.1 hypothetical protein AQ939_08895 [Burkholderia pseudomallei]OND80621.1 hypothetical protein AQ940_05025 [Burkholderia pseudomallei]